MSKDDIEVRTEMIVREINNREKMMEFDYSKEYKISHDRDEFTINDILDYFVIPLLTAMGYNYANICDYINTETTEYFKQRLKEDD